MRGHRIGRAEYDARYAELDVERKTLAGSEPRPVFLRQRDMLRPLVDDWRDMETRERRRLIEDVFAEIRANEASVTEFLRRDERRPYMRAVLTPELRVSTERKTGLYVPNVETTRLARDERGWLCLRG